MNNGKKVSFWQFINDADNKRILVPKIQRDYVQGRDNDKVRYSLNVLLTDMHDALQNGKSLDLNYVYGKVYDHEFIPIDGQQRLTTLLLLHMYAFSREGKRDELKSLHRFDYETRPTTQRFLKQLIDHLPDFFEKGASYNTIGEFIEDAAWFSSSWKLDPSVISCIKVLNEIQRVFACNSIADRLLSQDCPITYMYQPIDNMGNENDLYIKMNSRGKSLTEFEIFKSDLFEFVDEICKLNASAVPADFKTNIDTTWMSVVWKIAKDDENKNLKCDEYYITLLHWMLVNHIFIDGVSVGAISPKEKNSLINNGRFYNFGNYRKQFIRNGVLDQLDSATALNKIYKTMSLFELLETDLPLCEKVFRDILGGAVLRVTMPSRVFLYAITKYALSVDKLDLDSFRAWYRIVGNLINNIRFDVEEDYIKGCRAIDSLPKECFKNALEYFASDGQVAFFTGEQVHEECDKAKRILRDSNWKAPILHAEAFEYFNGQIGFAFRLLDQTAHDEIKEFQEIWEIVEKLFAKDGPILAEDEKFLFHRALLTFGDYSISMQSSANTFFFEGGNNYYNWRRMLREPKSFDVFKQFFNYVRSLNKPVDYIGEMENLIQSYVSSKDEFINLLIKVPALFEYMKKNTYRIDSTRNKRIVLLSKEQLNAYYAEVYTYALKIKLEEEGYIVDYHYGRGYFNVPTSESYIENISAPNPSSVHYQNIKYENGRFTVDGMLLTDANGNEIGKVDDAIQVI